VRRITPEAPAGDENIRENMVESAYWYIADTEVVISMSYDIYVSFQYKSEVIFCNFVSQKPAMPLKTLIAMSLALHTM